MRYLVVIDQFIKYLLIPLIIESHFLFRRQYKYSFTFTTTSHMIYVSSSLAFSHIISAFHYWSSDPVINNIIMICLLAWLFFLPQIFFISTLSYHFIPQYSRQPLFLLNLFMIIDSFPCTLSFFYSFLYL